MAAVSARSHMTYSTDHTQYSRGRGNYSNRGYRSNYRARSRSRNDYGNGRNDRFDNRQSHTRENFRQDHGEQRYRARNISWFEIGLDND